MIGLRRRAAMILSVGLMVLPLAACGGGGGGGGSGGGGTITPPPPPPPPPPPSASTPSASTAAAPTADRLLERVSAQLRPGQHQGSVGLAVGRDRGRGHGRGGRFRHRQHHAGVGRADFQRLDRRGRRPQHALCRIQQPRHAGVGRHRFQLQWVRHDRRGLSVDHPVDPHRHLGLHRQGEQGLFHQLGPGAGPGLRRRKRGQDHQHVSGGRRTAGVGLRGRLAARSQFRGGDRRLFGQ